MVVFIPIFQEWVTFMSIFRHNPAVGNDEITGTLEVCVPARVRSIEYLGVVQSTWPFLLRSETYTVHAKHHARRKLGKSSFVIGKRPCIETVGKRLDGPNLMTKCFIPASEVERRQC